MGGCRALCYTLLRLVTLASALQVIDKSGNLYITSGTASPDGFTRAALLAGRSLNDMSATTPGPMIIGDKGDTFEINVKNRINNPALNTSTSIHWHGIDQKETNWVDGVSFVTQCPIVSGDDFTYRFKVPDQAGTFWYHSHLNMQLCDGLKGPLIVYDQDDPNKHLYDVDNGEYKNVQISVPDTDPQPTEHTVLTLSDWHHVLSPQLIGSPNVPPPSATLINGKGRNPANVTTELATVNITQGKRYRFRLINMACVTSYSFSIDQHMLSVIETDGQSTKPYHLNSLTIFPGQRYSVVLNANQPRGNYWIRSSPNVGPQGFTNGINSAILRYSGALDVEPTSINTGPGDNGPPFLESNLRSRGHNAPGGNCTGIECVDHIVNLELSSDIPGQPGFRFRMNGVAFNPPPIPVLLQILSGAQRGEDLMPADSVWVLPRNKVIEIRLSGGNAIAGPHPIHLHGQSFWVVKSADSEVYNFDHPVRRDTTAVAAGNTTVIRFRSDNPGPWFIHCHIDTHLELGMAFLMVTDFEGTKDEVHPSGQWKDLCPKYQRALANNQ